VRRILIGSIVATFGIAAALSPAYSAGARPGSSHQAQRLAKALRTCQKEKPESKRKKCEKTAEAKYKPETTTGGEKGSGAGTTTGAGTATGTGTGTGAGTGTGTGATSTGTTTSAPEALTGTIIFHEYGIGGPPLPGTDVPICHGTTCPQEGGKVYIARVGEGERLGPNGENLSAIETPERVIHVAPGEYEVGRKVATNFVGPAGEPLGKTYSYETQRVTVEAGQTVEVVAHGAPIP
jgi:hypothetical protein